MEFIDKLNSLAAKIRQQKAAIQTEEATKNAFVMPFIHSVLGYDVFDPTEVIPETAQRRLANDMDSPTP